MRLRAQPLIWKCFFHSDASKTPFHKIGCALGLILKVRVFGTRKWPIAFEEEFCGLPSACGSPMKGLIQRVNVGGFYQPKKSVNLASHTRALCQSKSRDWWLCVVYIWSVGVTLLVRT